MANMRPALRVTLTLILLALVSSQAPEDVLNGTCRRYGHQTAIVDRKLYIDGGFIYGELGSQDPIPVMNQKLIYSDLDDTTDGMPTQHAGLSKDRSVPSVSGGILWADEINKIFWLYGGEFISPPKDNFELWGYDTVSDKWMKSDAASTAASSIQRVSYGAGTTMHRKGYYYGGYLNSNTNPFWLGKPQATTGLITFDMNTNVLRNNTGPDAVGRAEGVMVAIPASTYGMLVYFGGVQSSQRNSTQGAMNMSMILLYDIGDNKWYHQIATGDVPGNRRKFCAGVTWANDQSSYNIYIYGGLGIGANSSGYDDAYVLSLPTFQWIKIYPTTFGEAYPKGLTTCNVVERAQMIIMGGNYTNYSGCDVPSVGGQHNMNLGRHNTAESFWYSYASNLTDYSVPKDILNIVGGTAEGQATNMTPVNGWSDATLAVYFSQKAQFSGEYVPEPPAISIPDTTNENADGITGGAVGGGIALLLLIIFAWWSFIKIRRGRKHHSSCEKHEKPEIQAIPLGVFHRAANQHSKSFATFNEVRSSPNPDLGWADQKLRDRTSAMDLTLPVQSTWKHSKQHFPRQKHERSRSQTSYLPLTMGPQHVEQVDLQQNIQPYYPPPPEKQSLLSLERIRSDRE